MSTPGGSTIITSVFQTILNVVEFGQGMQQAVTSKRFHHQWLPDEVSVDPNTVSAETRADLEKKGYVFKNTRSIGRVNAILVNPDGAYEGGADPRGDDTTAGW